MFALHPAPTTAVMLSPTPSHAPPELTAAEGQIQIEDFQVLQPCGLAVAVPPAAPGS